MTVVLTLAALAVALAAAARSTWSPCGLSMLSSITPIGERGRGQRFRVTATWFVLGAIAGGATLGAALSIGAAALAAWAPPTRLLVSVGAIAAAAAAAVDLGVFGVRIPLLRRQVNEVWLDRFRSWVYGAGFGWQIGVGFSTYVMTAAVGLVAVRGVFGMARGLTVLIGRRGTSAAALRAAHRRLAGLRRPVWVAVIAAQVVVAVGLSGLVWGPAGLVEAAGAVATLAVGRPTTVRRRAAQSL